MKQKPLPRLVKNPTKQQQVMLAKQRDFRNRELFLWYWLGKEKFHDFWIGHLSGLGKGDLYRGVYAVFFFKQDGIDHFCFSKRIFSAFSVRKKG